MNRNGYLIGIGIVVTLAGCAVVDDTSTGQPDRATPAPSSTAVPSTKSPEPDQNAVDLTCETLLPQGWNDQVLSGENPRNPALFPDLAEKFLGTRFSDLGGVGCAVGYPDTDLATIYGWSPRRAR